MNRFGLICMLFLVLVGCKRQESTGGGEGQSSGTGSTQTNPVPPSTSSQSLTGPSKVAGVFLESLQQGNLSRAVDQMSQWNTSQDAIYSALLDNNAMSEALYGKLQFTVGSTQVQGDQATVNLKLSNVHLAKGLASKWTSAIASNLTGVLSGQIDPQQVLQEIITDASKDTKLERFSYDGKLNLRKTGGTWKIQPDADLLNTISADLLKPIQNFLGRLQPQNP